LSSSLRPPPPMMTINNISVISSSTSI
jgi:hypothetical protein